MPSRPSNKGKDVFFQLKISRRAADLLRKRAKRSLRTQAGYVRTLLYRDLGLFDDQERGR